MAIIKEIAEQERARLQAGVRNELHLYREGAFLRAYEWSAWLANRFLHEFKANKRQFKGCDEPVIYIGFPESSLLKWLPEGLEQRMPEENHLVLMLPDALLAGVMDTIEQNYASWCDAIPLAEPKTNSKKSRVSAGSDRPAAPAAATDSTTLTGIMQRILAYPLENRSPLECMTFLADVKQQLVQLF